MAGAVVGEPFVHEALAGLVHPDAAPHHRVEDRHGRRGRRRPARTTPRRAARCRRRRRCRRAARRRCWSARPSSTRRSSAAGTAGAVPGWPRTRRRRAARPDRRRAGPARRLLIASTPTTDPSSSRIRRSNAVLVRTSPLPVLMNASSPRPMSACPPTIVSGASTPQRSVHSGGRTSGSRSPSSRRSIVAREDRAALAQRAGRIGEVVGHAAPLELADRRVRLEFLDHARPGFEVRLAQRDGSVVADDRVEVGAGRVGSALEAGAHFGRVAGEPDAGARPGRRAADVRPTSRSRASAGREPPPRRPRTVHRPSRRR